jgi:hypothetical protein
MMSSKILLFFADRVMRYVIDMIALGRVLLNLSRRRAQV